METKSRSQRKNVDESKTTESGLVVRNSKVKLHKRKSAKTPLREWQTTGSQFHQTDDLCAEVYIVIPTGQNATYSKSNHKEAIVSKSEYDTAEPDLNLFSKDLVGHYLHEVQSETSIKAKKKLAKITDSHIKNERLGRSTNHESPGSVAVTIKTLQFDTMIPQKQSFVLHSPFSKLRSKLPSGGKHAPPNSPVTCSQPISNEQVSCPSHVYSFDRGLIPSREAQDLELPHTQHFLPSVIADRIRNISERKHYRLSLEKDSGENSNNDILNEFFPLNLNTRNLKGPKSVVWKEFSTETVIPASYERKRYFDFPGYIEFLCKERDQGKISTKTAKKLDDYDCEIFEPSPRFDNLGNVLVKDVYNRILDIKGSTMKLEKNPAMQMKSQIKPLSELHQHCFPGNSSNVYFNPYRTKLTKLKSRKPMERTAVIERFPRKFQFTIPGRPLSSDDSGYAE